MGDTKWKKNVRQRSARKHPLGEQCKLCRRRFAPSKLGRHHEWEHRKPHDPPTVEGVYCKRCHMIMEGRLKPFTCEDCGKTGHGWLAHIRRCQPRKDRVNRESVAHLLAYGRPIPPGLQRYLSTEAT